MIGGHAAQAEEGGGCFLRQIHVAAAYRLAGDNELAYRIRRQDIAESIQHINLCVVDRAADRDVVAAFKTLCAAGDGAFCGAVSVDDDDLRRKLSERIVCDPQVQGASVAPRRQLQQAHRKRHCWPLSAVSPRPGCSLAYLLDRPTYSRFSGKKTGPSVASSYPNQHGLEARNAGCYSFGHRVIAS